MFVVFQHMYREIYKKTNIRGYTLHRMSFDIKIPEMNVQFWRDTEVIHKWRWDLDGAWLLDTFEDIKIALSNYVLKKRTLYKKRKIITRPRREAHLCNYERFEIYEPWLIKNKFLTYIELGLEGERFFEDDKQPATNDDCAYMVLYNVYTMGVFGNTDWSEIWSLSEYNVTLLKLSYSPNDGFNIYYSEGAKRLSYLFYKRVNEISHKTRTGISSYRGKARLFKISLVYNHSRICRPHALDMSYEFFSEKGDQVINLLRCYDLSNNIYSCILFLHSLNDMQRNYYSNLENKFFISTSSTLLIKMDFRFYSYNSFIKYKGIFVIGSLIRKIFNKVRALNSAHRFYNAVNRNIWCYPSSFKNLSVIYYYSHISELIGDYGLNILGLLCSMLIWDHTLDIKEFFEFKKNINREHMFFMLPINGALLLQAQVVRSSNLDIFKYHYMHMIIAKSVYSFRSSYFEYMNLSFMPPLTERISFFDYKCNDMWHGIDNDHRDFVIFYIYSMTRCDLRRYDPAFLLSQIKEVTYEWVYELMLHPKEFYDDYELKLNDLESYKCYRYLVLEEKLLRTYKNFPRVISSDIVYSDRTKLWWCWENYFLYFKNYVWHFIKLKRKILYTHSKMRIWGAYSIDNFYFFTTIKYFFFVRVWAYCDEFTYRWICYIAFSFRLFRNFFYNPTDILVNDHLIIFDVSNIYEILRTLACIFVKKKIFQGVYRESKSYSNYNNLKRFHEQREFVEIGSDGQSNVSPTSYNRFGVLDCFKRQYMLSISPGIYKWVNILKNSQLQSVIRETISHLFKQNYTFNKLQIYLNEKNSPYSQIIMFPLYNLLKYRNKEINLNIVYDPNDLFEYDHNTIIELGRVYLTSNSFIKYDEGCLLLDDFEVDAIKKVSSFGVVKYSRGILVFNDTVKDRSYIRGLDLGLVSINTRFYLYYRYEDNNDLHSFDRKNKEVALPNSLYLVSSASGLLEKFIVLFKRHLFWKPISWGRIGKVIFNYNVAVETKLFYKFRGVLIRVRKKLIFAEKTDDDFRWRYDLEWDLVGSIVRSVLLLEDIAVPYHFFKMLYWWFVKTFTIMDRATMILVDFLYSDLYKLLYELMSRIAQYYTWDTKVNQRYDGIIGLFSEVDILLHNQSKTSSFYNKKYIGGGHNVWYCNLMSDEPVSSLRYVYEVCDSSQLYFILVDKNRTLYVYANIGKFYTYVMPMPNTLVYSVYFITAALVAPENELWYKSCYRILDYFTTLLNNYGLASLPRIYEHVYFIFFVMGLPIKEVTLFSKVLNKLVKCWYSFVIRIIDIDAFIQETFTESKILFCWYYNNNTEVGVIKPWIEAYEYMSLNLYINFCVDYIKYKFFINDSRSFMDDEISNLFEFCYCGGLFFISNLSLVNINRYSGETLYIYDKYILNGDYFSWRLKNYSSDVSNILLLFKGCIRGPLFLNFLFLNIYIFYVRFFYTWYSIRDVGSFNNLNRVSVKRSFLGLEVFNFNCEYLFEINEWIDEMVFGFWQVEYFIDIARIGGVDGIYFKPLNLDWSPIAITLIKRFIKPWVAIMSSRFTLLQGLRTNWDRTFDTRRSLFSSSCDGFGVDAVLCTVKTYWSIDNILYVNINLAPYRDYRHSVVIFANELSPILFIESESLDFIDKESCVDLSRLLSRNTKIRHSWTFYKFRELLWAKNIFLQIRILSIDAFYKTIIPKRGNVLNYINILLNVTSFTVNLSYYNITSIFASRMYNTYNFNRIRKLPNLADNYICSYSGPAFLDYNKLDLVEINNWWMTGLSRENFDLFNEKDFEKTVCWDLTYIIWYYYITASLESALRINFGNISKEVKIWVYGKKYFEKIKISERDMLIWRYYNRMIRETIRIDSDFWGAFIPPYRYYRLHNVDSIRSYKFRLDYDICINRFMWWYTRIRINHINETNNFLYFIGEYGPKIDTRYEYCERYTCWVIRGCPYSYEYFWKLIKTDFLLYEKERSIFYNIDIGDITIIFKDLLKLKKKKKVIMYHQFFDITLDEILEFFPDLKTKNNYLVMTTYNFYNHFDIIYYFWYKIWWIIFRIDFAGMVRNTRWLFFHAYNFKIPYVYRFSEPHRLQYFFIRTTLNWDKINYGFIYLNTDDGLVYSDLYLRHLYNNRRIGASLNSLLSIPRATQYLTSNFSVKMHEEKREYLAWILHYMLIRCKFFYNMERILPKDELIYKFGWWEWAEYNWTRSNDTERVYRVFMRTSLDKKRFFIRQKKKTLKIRLDASLMFQFNSSSNALNEVWGEYLIKPIIHIFNLKLFSCMVGSDYHILNYNYIAAFENMQVWVGYYIYRFLARRATYDFLYDESSAERIESHRAWISETDKPTIDSIWLNKPILREKGGVVKNVYIFPKYRRRVLRQELIDKEEEFIS